MWVNSRMNLHRIANQISLEYKREMDERLFAFLRIHNLSYATDYDTIMQDLSKKKMVIQVDWHPNVNGKITVIFSVYKEMKSQKFDILPPEFNYSRY